MTKMAVVIEENAKGYCIAVREWAELQIGKPLKSTYKHKSNAIRAVRDPKRNTVTLLCQLAWESTKRAAQLEIILSQITKALGDYSEDVGSAFGDAGPLGSSDSSSSGSDGETGGSDSSSR